jgi:hypothetical protein
VASRHVHNQAGSLEACNDGVGGAVQVPPAFRLLRFVVEAARRLITHQTARSAHASSHRSSRAATGYAAALADAPLPGGQQASSRSWTRGWRRW